MAVAKVKINGAWVPLTGGTGVVRSSTPPTDTNVIWADTSDTTVSPPPYLIAANMGKLDSTGSGDFWLPKDQGVAWTGNGLQGSHIFRMNRSELLRYKGGANVSLRMKLDVITNATAWGGTIQLGLWEITGPASGGGGAAVVGVGAGATRMITAAASMPAASLVSKGLSSITTTLDTTNFPNDDGLYAMFIRMSGAGPANSSFIAVGTLEMI